jgi:hypothetical protein
MSRTPLLKRQKVSWSSGVAHGILAALLASCGGGGGGSGGGSSGGGGTPSFTAPTSVTRVTASGYRAMHLDVMYGSGTGGSSAAGTIAVLDDGVNFGGAFLPASKSVAGRNFISQAGGAALYASPGYAGDPKRDTQGIGAHGTTVASIAAGQLDVTTGRAGFAWNATVMPVRVYTDRAGTQDTRTLLQMQGVEGPGFYNAGEQAAMMPFGRAFLDAVSEGLVHVVRSPDVRVANTSLFGPDFEQSVRAFDIARLPGADQKVFVYAAGNAGQALPGGLIPVPVAGDPTPFGGAALAPPLVSPGNVLVVGTVDALYRVDNAGAGNCQAFFLVVPEVGATSWAAPVVSGAAYTLLCEWPALTGAEVCRILLTTASKSVNGVVGDLNTPNLAGQGMLNMRAALMPLGKVQVPVAAQTAVPALVPYARTNAWLGDLLNAITINPGDFASVLTFDSYGRHYAFNMNSRIQSHGGSGGGLSFFQRVMDLSVRSSGGNRQRGSLALSDQAGLAFSTSSPGESGHGFSRWTERMWGMLPLPQGRMERPSPLSGYGFFSLGEGYHLQMAQGRADLFAGWMSGHEGQGHEQLIQGSEPSVWDLFPGMPRSVCLSRPLNDRWQAGLQQVQTKAPAEWGRFSEEPGESNSSARARAEGWVTHASLKLTPDSVVNFSLGRIDERAGWMGSSGQGALSLGARQASHFGSVRARIRITPRHAITFYTTSVHTSAHKVSGSLFESITPTWAMAAGIRTEHRTDVGGLLQFHAGLPLQVMKGSMTLALPRLVNRMTREVAHDRKQVNLKTRSSFTFEASYEQPLKALDKVTWGVAATAHVHAPGTGQRTETGLLACLKIAS